ncbi:uncharacterized protein BX663DRAFT_439782 [Cokeromyces recurvatus]|uniref:uncharacterized protein n=1 Tax=Cokeromyces recurvatus TaxID=90255 RepID=UPI00221EBD24|nr:uncharacterized protein BX663DRAFT_439782 [Cokeromyces recurvatus]KAI7900234.1 hypothetical protein BX663DRAFT_439782 [Cokeromyces recurvatus]
MIFTEKNKALLILGGKIYSRLPSLDAQYEKTSSIKNGNIPQSSLPHVHSRYENIKVVLMDYDNTKKKKKKKKKKKLVLGTKTMNLLLTSSIRPDNNEHPIISASSSNGFIPSRDTRIFVDRHKLQDIKTLIQRTAPLNEIKLQ